MKHKHAELIIAWANGAKIQAKQMDGDWMEIENPKWQNRIEYRIKPELQPDVVTHLLCELKNRLGEVFFTDEARYIKNLRLTFDGETGNLKSAEVLK